MQTQRGKLIIVSAPSGAGKTTLVHHLLNAGLELEFSVSATNRPIRTGEVDGLDYYFISKDDFQHKITNEEFLEWEEVYDGVYYGTLRMEVESRIERGHHIIFDVDVKGGINIKRHFNRQALSIFIKPPSIEALEQRLRLRSSDPEKSILRRLDKAEHEMGFATEFDYIIINDNLKRASEEITNLVKDFLTTTSK